MPTADSERAACSPKIDGRMRLPPAFGARSVDDLSGDHVREFVAKLAEAVEAGSAARVSARPAGRDERENFSDGG
jgi:hypothetical protein